ncbi:hypothetical protein FQR65_LT16652 [Abscondita terminalis]|nr:hypothetical protein FQR65_LT16652 [Abscondita terminalis]
MKERVIIIGANGQIGTELAFALRQKFGYENVITSDIREPKSLAENEILKSLTPQKEEQISQEESAAITRETQKHLAATAEDNKEAPQTPAKPWDSDQIQSWFTTVKKEQQEQTPQEESAAINKETIEIPSSATAEDNKEASQTPAKPLGFRPKFKAGVTTVKKEQEEQNPQTESTAIENKETIEIPSSANAEDNKEAPQAPCLNLWIQTQIQSWRKNLECEGKALTL